MLLSDNFLIGLYLVLFLINLPSQLFISLQFIWSMRYFILAQLSPCHTGKRLSALVELWTLLIHTLLSLIIGVASKDRILQQIMFGKVSHMKARPTQVVNGCHLLHIMQIGCSIWESSKVSVQFPVFDMMCVQLQWRKDYALCVFNDCILFEELKSLV